jgi:hypothetical protein
MNTRCGQVLVATESFIVFVGRKGEIGKKPLYGKPIITRLDRLRDHQPSLLQPSLLDGVSRTAENGVCRGQGRSGRRHCGSNQQQIEH